MELKHGAKGLAVAFAQEHSNEIKDNRQHEAIVNHSVGIVWLGGVEFPR